MGCGSRQTNPSEEADASQIKVGDTFVIELDSNPTTGYSWSLAKAEPNIVEKVSSVYQPRRTAERLVGSGGTEIWTFKAIAKGQTTLTFEYRRPWEKGTPPAKEETYTVIIK